MEQGTFIRPTARRRSCWVPPWATGPCASPAVRSAQVAGCDALTGDQIDRQRSSHDRADLVGAQCLPRSRPQDDEVIPRQHCAGGEIPHSPDAAPLQHDGLLLVVFDLLLAVAQGCLEQSSVVDHGAPRRRIHGEAVIRADAGCVVGEVLLDHSCAEGNSTEDGHVARCVVGESEGHVREELRVLRDDSQVRMVGVLDRAGVVGVALHQDDVHACGLEQIHGSRDVLEISGARRDQHGLAEVSDDLKLLQPVDITGADLEGVDVRIQVGDGFKVVGSGHELDADLLRVLGQRLRPLPRQAGVLIDLEHTLLPGCLVRLLATKGPEAVVGHDVLGPEVLELRAVGASILGEGHEVLGSLEITVMVRGDVGDEVGRLIRADKALADAEGRHRFIVGAAWTGGRRPFALTYRRSRREPQTTLVGWILAGGLCFGTLVLAGCSSDQATEAPSSPASSSAAPSVEEPEGASASAAASPTDLPAEELEALGDIEVDTGLLTVTVTIPSDLALGTTQAEIDAAIAEGEVLEGSINDDGAVTYVMSSAQHTTALDELRAGIDEMVAEDEKTNPGLYDEVTFNDDMSEFDIVVSSEQAYRDSMSMMTMSLLFSAAIFQVFAGVQEEDRGVILTFIDGETGETFDTYDSRDSDY